MSHERVGRQCLVHHTQRFGFFADELSRRQQQIECLGLADQAWQ
jgi:hypothetical protein